MNASKSWPDPNVNYTFEEVVRALNEDGFVRFDDRGRESSPTFLTRNHDV